MCPHTPVILLTTLQLCRPYNDISVGVIPNPHLCLSEEDGVIHYSFQVYFKAIDAGVCTDDLPSIEGYLTQLNTLWFAPVYVNTFHLYDLTPRTW